MFAVVGALLVVGLAQDPTTDTSPRPSAPSLRPRALQRAIDDARVACQNLLATDHAFTGSAILHVGPTLGEMAVEPASYRGAAKGPLHLFAVDRHTILTAHGKRFERLTGGTWTLPQGDAPDCPLSPTVLATHLPTATIDACQPSSHGDRPAVRVHAIWKDGPAVALVDELSMLDSKSNGILESVAAMARKRGNDRVTVDASACFDPAGKNLYGATLRIAVMQPNEPREGDEPAPCPDGLPPLRKDLVLQFLFEVAVLPAAKEPMPPLDATLRERLGLPAK